MPCLCALVRLWTSLDPAAQSVHILHANPNLTLVIHHAPSAKPLRVMRRQSKVHASHQPGAPPACLVPPKAQPPEQHTDTTRPLQRRPQAHPPVASSPALLDDLVALLYCCYCYTHCYYTLLSLVYYTTIHIPLSPSPPASQPRQPRATV